VVTNARSDRLDNGQACLIVTGAPAAGKSTVSSLVAEHLNSSARIDGYFISTLVASGYVWPLGEPAHEAARQVQLCNRNLCALAANFADSGFTPVIDTVIPEREQLDFFVDTLSPRRVLVVVLAPTIDICHHRNAIRDPEEQFFFDDYEGLTASMRAGFGSLGWWFDTSALTPHETAARILADAPALARVGR
jgi:adenylylsulfate kinase-like enzyme